MTDEIIIICPFLLVLIQIQNQDVTAGISLGFFNR